MILNRLWVKGFALHMWLRTIPIERQC